MRYLYNDSQELRRIGSMMGFTLQRFQMQPSPLTSGIVCVHMVTLYVGVGLLWLDLA